MTLDERHGAELFETGSRRLETLSGSLSSSGGVHDEGVSRPESRPSLWTLWDGGVLRVDCDDLGRHFADGTSRNVWTDGGSGDWVHHRSHRFVGRQPERVVVSAGHVADAVHVAEHEWHCVEFGETRSGLSEVLTTGTSVSLHIEQRISFPKLRSSWWTLWHGGGLRVLGKSKSTAWSPSSWCSRESWSSWKTRESSTSTFSLVSLISSVSWGSWKSWWSWIAVDSWSSWISGLSWWSRKSWNESYLN